MCVLGLQSDADMEDDFSFLQPLDFITKDAYQLQKIVREKKDRMNAANNESKQESEREVEVERKEEEIRDDKSEKDREQEIGKEEEKSNQDRSEMEPEENGTGGGNLR